MKYIKEVSFFKIDKQNKLKIINKFEFAKTINA